MFKSALNIRAKELEAYDQFFSGASDVQELWDLCRSRDDVAKKVAKISDIEHANCCDLTSIQPHNTAKLPSTSTLKSSREVVDRKAREGGYS